MLVLRGTPAAVDDEFDPVVRCFGRSLAQGAEQISVEVGGTRDLVVGDRRVVGDGLSSLAGGGAAAVEGVGSIEEEGVGDW